MPESNFKTTLLIFTLIRLLYLAVFGFLVFKFRQKVFNFIIVCKKSFIFAFDLQKTDSITSHIPIAFAVILLGGAVLTGLWFFFATSDYVLDDALITARYAKHFAEGHGPVWNVDEPSAEGYTSLSYMLLLTLFECTAVPIHLSLRMLGVVSLLLLIWLFFRLTGSLHLPLPYRIASISFLIANPLLCFSANNGLETILFSAFALYFPATWSIAQKEDATSAQKWWMFILAICLVSTRPEGFAPVTALFGIQALIGLKKKKLVANVWPLALLAAFTALLSLFRWLVYDDLLPNTFYMKGKMSFNGENLQQILEFLHINRAYCLLAILGAVALWRNNKILFIALTTVLAILPYYLFTAMIMNIYYRYFIFTLPILIALAGLGLLVAGRFLSRLLPASLCILILCGTCIGCITLSLKTGKWPVRYARSYGDMIFNSHAALGKIFANHLEPKSLIAVGDAGAIPYYSDLPTVDYLGLNDKTIAKKIKTNNMAVADYLMDKKPSVIVLVVTTGDDKDKAFGGLVGRIIGHPFFSNYRRTATNCAHWGYCQAVYLRNDIEPDDNFFSALKAWENRKKTEDSRKTY